MFLVKNSFKLFKRSYVFSLRALRRYRPNSSGVLILVENFNVSLLYKFPFKYFYQTYE